MVLKPMSLAAIPDQRKCECSRFQLREDDADVEGALGRLGSGELFDGLAERERMHVGADAADALHERDSLQIIAALGEILDAAKVEGRHSLLRRARSRRRRPVSSLYGSSSAG